MSLRVGLLSAVSAVSLSLAAGAAFAQTSDQPQDATAAQQPTTTTQAKETADELVVTGVRASIASAIQVKKNSDQIVDSIVSEDIGKLPDNNVIEALQHVTGVQVSRNAAEADQLLVRGLPDIATLLNGREIFTSTGRFITLQDIPAELLARVDVEKSPRADDIEGGIAGLIDVRLHRPFDFKGEEVAGTLRGTYSGLSGSWDPSGSALFSDRWTTSSGEWGLLIDVSGSRDRYKEEILDNYISSQSISPVPGSTAPDGAGYLPLTEGGQSINGDRKREALDVSLQWRPNDNLELFAEAFYTRFRNPNNNDFFVGLPWICADAPTATLFPGTNEVKTVTGGCYDLTSDQVFLPRTDTWQAATGGTWNRGPLTLSTELDYTYSHFYQDGYILDTEYSPPFDGYTADFNYQGTGTPYMNVTGIDLTDPNNYRMRQFYDQRTDQKGHEFDWRADLAYDLGGSGGVFKSIGAGVRYVDRVADNHQANGGGLDCDGGDVGAPGCFTTLGSQPGSSHVTAGSIFDGKFGLTHWMDVDPEWLIRNVQQVRAMFGQPTTPPPDDPTQSFYDNEQSFAGYVKSNFAFGSDAHPVIGNIGLRLVDTDADMKGNTVITSTDANGVTTTTLTPTESKKNTLDWLPSLNARLTLTDGLFLRLSLSRTVTHPQFASLNPGLTLTDSTATLLGSGSSGNPDLGPEKSNNADVSLEYYWGGKNTITAAAFYRNVDGYIQSTIAPLVINGITYQVSRPINAASGHIDGVEVGYTQFFDFLPGLLGGLGMQANATYVEGAFQNISKWSCNLIGIYEKGPVSLRLAYNWRDGFDVGPAPGGGQQPSEIYAKSQPWLDFSANYQLSRQLSLTLDATNLLDSAYQDYFGVQGVYPRDTRRFDQTITVGVRFRM